MTGDRVLTTERLILRPLTIEDAVDLHISLSDRTTTRYWHTLPHTTLVETQAMIEKMLQVSSNCWWSIRLQNSQQTIGMIGHHGNTNVPGFGYLLHSAHWRQGLATEALQATIAYAFRVLLLDRIELWIHGDNVPSIKLAEKVGFTRRGRLRQRFGGQPAIHDVLVYGLHMQEWAQLTTTTSEKQSPRHIHSLQPVLAVPDIAQTVAFYRDVLGFAVDFMYGNPPIHAAVFQGEWSCEGARIQFTQAERNQTQLPDGWLYFFVLEDIDSLFARYVAGGAKVIATPQSQPWGMREFTITDCNGYLLRFGVAV